MAGTESQPSARTRARRLLTGAAVGALVVGTLAGTLGTLIEGFTGAIALLCFAAVGAVLGAYAWSVVAYERDHDPAEVPELRELLDQPAEPETGLGWLWRRHAGAFARLPLTPWI